MAVKPTQTVLLPILDRMLIQDAFPVKTKLKNILEYVESPYPKVIYAMLSLNLVTFTFFLVAWAAAASYYNNLLNSLLTMPQHLLHHLTHWFPYRQAGNITHWHSLYHTLIRSTFILHFICSVKHPNCRTLQMIPDYSCKLIWNCDNHQIALQVISTALKTSVWHMGFICIWFDILSFLSLLSLSSVFWWQLLSLSGLCQGWARVQMNI